MRVPLIISPSGQPLAKAQHPCKPPIKGNQKDRTRRQNQEVRRLQIVRVHMLCFIVFKQNILKYDYCSKIN